MILLMGDSRGRIVDRASNKVIPIEGEDSYRRFLPANHRDAAQVSALDRWLARKLLKALSGSLFIDLWNGERLTLDGARPRYGFRISSSSALRWLMRNPNLHFGDLFSLGAIEVRGDLVGFAEVVYRSVAAARTKSRLLQLFWRDHKPRSTSLQAARQNIHHHYDLGNEFYSLWLDCDAMQYTCGYFPEPDMTLEDGQRAKLHHICRKLSLAPGQRVVEAGCGWGGLARFMAREYGVHVTAFNISHEQIVFARQQAQREGLEGRIDYVEDDYRNIDGNFDKFVSIGMLEHVGCEHYRELGRIIDGCLARDGMGLIHTIGRNQPQNMNAWIEERIFPGAYPPTLAQMDQVFAAGDFSILDVENLRLHYSETLKQWLERFDAHRDEIAQMYDQFFVRAWRLYLCGSIAAFNVGALQLFQVVFNRADSNLMPRSRAHLYGAADVDSFATEVNSGAM
jgi:cyclopropane-fatty-acyl-phospholipid synthase